MEPQHNHPQGQLRQDSSHLPYSLFCLMFCRFQSFLIFTKSDSSESTSTRSLPPWPPRPSCPPVATDAEPEVRKVVFFLLRLILKQFMVLGPVLVKSCRT